MPVPLFDLTWDVEAIFISRPNRFLGIVDITASDGTIIANEKAHVHDPGRLEELLYQGNRVLLKRATGKHRKTAWDVIAARCGRQWVLVHSGYHRRIAETVLGISDISPFGKLKTIKAEVKMGHSRLDFLLTREDGTGMALEVKGCTLTQDGVALFPDAPTERGRRHLETLIELKKSGMDACLLILVFRHNSTCFSPNVQTDPAFSKSFEKAVGAGVEIYPLVFRYDGRKLSYMKKIPLCSHKGFRMKREYHGQRNASERTAEHTTL